ncbi:MAG TPA: uracil phosphoribosyltransferase [Bacilli bacterium]|jgi:uracil phosphoribosyltransferase|nr:uracil phosphoribosyltransferase [Acholeplasmataceae bacterium]HOA77844.1 uracil phosphoribosyltransferase [Bacilli bacterium]HPZ26672.1 uracil phosphoribosyltransferase [Bacilli bacterium]HQC88922.1 uracil phosphoribosyltransferase [Bacilli bacterium]
MSGKLIILNHPLIHHKLALIRDEKTGTKDFRQTVAEVAMLMAYEVTRDLPTRKMSVKTPVGLAEVYVLAKEVVIVPILRAGLGMVDSITTLIPTAKVGHIGVYRDERTLEPHEYYAKLPGIVSEASVLVVDPMLATGGSVKHAIDILKSKGVTDISYVGLVGAPEGVRKIQQSHPDVNIFLAALDEKLNEHGFIVPGLGDCGDRLFGTK